MTVPLFAPPTPPYPKTAPRNFAALRAIRTNVLDLWAEEAYRDASYTFQILGKPVFLFNAPDAVRRVLVENHENYGRSPIRVRILRPIMGQGVLIAEGDSWRHQRRVLAPAFAPRSMGVLAPHFARGAAEAVADLGAQSRGPVDMLEVLHDASIKVAAKGMFSLEVDSHLTELRGFTTRYLRILAKPFMLDVLLPPSIPSPYDLLRRRFRAQWMGFLDGLIARRMAMPRNPTPIDFFDLLRNAYEDDSGKAVVNSVLRDEVATMIVAGHETSSITMFWTMYLLASFPPAQEAIAAEASGLALTPDSAADDIGRLVYTRAVLSEAMRLYPAAFMIVRRALADDVVGGVKVPAGSMVMVAPWILHRHAANWKDPDVFDPGRFLPGATPPDRMSYLPFAVGPRVCIGAQFAMSEMTLMIASLLKAFRFSLDGDRPVLPVCVATTRPDHRPNFRVEPRG